MNLLRQAENELDIYEKQVQASTADSTDWKYAKSMIWCLRRLCRAVFPIIEKQGHSDSSYAVLMSMFIQLLWGKPLSALTDNFDEFNEITEEQIDDESNVTLYQSKRVSSFFMRVHKDGSKTFSDIDRVICTDGNTTWTNGYITKYVDSIYPITVPYMPERYIAEVNEYLLYDAPDKGDFDTIELVSIKFPDGTVDTKHSAVFTCHGDMETFEKITKKEFQARKAEVKDKSEEIDNEGRD